MNKACPTERKVAPPPGTAGRDPHRRMRAGEEIETFPEEVYRNAPIRREYRHINRDSHNPHR